MSSPTSDAAPNLPDPSVPSTPAHRQPLPREVRLLGWVSLAQDTGSEMLYPFLPTFITGTLGAPVVAVGVAEGLADATSSGMKLIAGRLASHRRRPWIAAGYGLAAIGKLIVALAFVWPVVLFGRTVDRLGKGIRGVPRDALIADVVEPGQRGRAFGLHRAMDTTGAVIGPLLGLALYHLLDGRIRAVLLIAVVPAIVSVALVGLVHEARTAAPTARRGAARASLPPGTWRVLAPLAVFALVNSSDALLLQRAHEVGLGVTEVVLAYVLYNLVYAVLGYPAGALSDRVPHRFVFAAGLVVFGVAYIGLGQSTSHGVVWALLPLYGAFTALTDGVAKAWISETVPTGSRTWALGLHGGTTGAAALIAGLWSGLAWGGSGRLPLTVSGIVALVVAVWVALAAGRHRTTDTPPGIVSA